MMDKRASPLTAETGGAALPLEDQKSCHESESPISSASSTESTRPNQNSEKLWLRRVSDVVSLALTPKRCRYDPDHPPQFNMWLNVLYAFSATFTVANLYYNQPILNRIAETFDVSFEKASSVATLMQSGYAGGLLLICPLGDMLRRRPFILSLIGITAAMWLGLCVTHSFTAFQALSFLCGLTTVTPQLMLPLVGDLAPADRKASSLSIVVSGLMGGMLVARLLSGVVANYADWRVIYWVAFGLQWALFAALWGFMPDYPASDDESVALSREGSPTRRVGAAAALYARMLASIAVLLLTKPLLLQACAVSFLLSFVFTSFWTTLTFLLASPPFEYPSFAIGLFALAGLVGIGLGPVFGRVVIDRFVPLFSALVGQAIALIGIVVGTFAGPSTVAGSVIEAVGIDLGAVLAQTANRAAIYTIDRGSINRINTAYMVCAFCGQLTGTAVGNRLYAQGGWRWSGGASIGAMGLSVLICVVRGPKETGWVGWHGGWGIRRDRKGGAGGGVEKAETGGADAAVTQVTGDANMTVTGEDSRADVEKGAQR